MRLPETTTDLPPAATPYHLLAMWVLVQAGRDFMRTGIWEKRYLRKYRSGFLLKPNPDLKFWCDSLAIDIEKITRKASEIVEMEKHRALEGK